MTPSTKLHLGSAGYCALLISLNWFRSVEYSRQLGLKSESLTPVGLAALLSLVVALYLGYRCVRAALARLEDGRKVREGRWIRSWAVLLYALPLLWHQISTSSWKEPDGAVATVTSGYGQAASSSIFILAILGLLLFQIYVRLTPDDDDPEADGTGSSGSSPIRA